MKSLIPVVMAGILGIYGMIVAVIISQRGTNLIIKSNTMRNILTGMDFRIWLQVWSVASVASYLFFHSGCWLFDR